MLEMMRCYKNDFYLSLRLDKWGASGSRWKDVKAKGGSAINSQNNEILIWIMKEVMKATVEKRENI